MNMSRELDIETEQRANRHEAVKQEELVRGEENQEAYIQGRRRRKARL